VDVADLATKSPISDRIEHGWWARVRRSARAAADPAGDRALGRLIFTTLDSGPATMNRLPRAWAGTAVQGLPCTCQHRGRGRETRENERGSPPVHDTQEGGLLRVRRTASPLAGVKAIGAHTTGILRARCNGGARVGGAERGRVAGGRRAPGTLEKGSAGGAKGKRRIPALVDARLTHGARRGRQ